MSEEEVPSSKTINSYEAGDYYVTAASWTNFHGKSYEIGIRQKEDGKFWLCQGEWNHQSVQDVANAMAILLSDKTQCYSPEWCQDHFQ